MYTVKFEFMVGENVYDKITGEYCEVVTTMYSNGKSMIAYDFFHETIYAIEKNGEIHYRYEENLEKTDLF